MGIEPMTTVWKTVTLPLSYTRINYYFLPRFLPLLRRDFLLADPTLRRPLRGLFLAG